MNVGIKVVVICRSRNSRVNGKRRTDLCTSSNLSKVHGQRTDWRHSKNHSYGTEK
jgi:hypothetical protein